MTIKSDTNGTNKIAVDSHGTAITGAFSVSNDITCSNTTATNLMANKKLTSKQTGDDFGESGVIIQQSRVRRSKCLCNK